MKRVYHIGLLFVGLMLIMTPGLALAQTSTPPGNLVIATPYTSVIASKGSPLTFTLDIVNNGKDYQNVNLQADGPTDWNPVFQQDVFTLRSVMVAPGKDQSVNFVVTPPVDAKAGNYAFTVRGTAPGGSTLASLPISIDLQDKVATTSLGLTTQYPEQSVQGGNTVTFTVTVNNVAGQDRSVNLAATAPADWQVTFKPAYGSNQITAASIKANSTQDVDVNVVVPSSAAAGSYQVVMTAAARNDKASLPLKVNVTGHDALSLTTASGQLNTNATVNSATKLGLQVQNTGTEPLQNVTLSASNPDGWQVTFDPAAIAQLPVGQTAQVNATITPSGQALAGDYQVTITASAGSASDNKDIRVTVQTPTTWGWGAVAAIVVVVGGLGTVFTRFSRR